MKLSNLGNSIPKLILSSPLHPIMSRRYLLLTFTGRKTHRSYTTPVAYLERDAAIILTTDSPWWSNLVNGAPVAVTLRGVPRCGTARVIRDPEAAVEGLAALVEAIRPYGRLTGVGRDNRGRANPIEARRAVEEGRVLIKIELEPRGGEA